MASIRWHFAWCTVPKAKMAAPTARVRLHSASGGKSSRAIPPMLHASGGESNRTASVAGIHDKLKCAVRGTRVR